MAENKEKVQKKQSTEKPKKKGRFFKEFTGEVKKLTWPTPKELLINTLTVLAFVAFFAILMGVLDIGLDAGRTALFNIGVSGS